MHHIVCGQVAHLNSVRRLTLKKHVAGAYVPGLSHTATFRLHALRHTTANSRQVAVCRENKKSILTAEWGDCFGYSDSDCGVQGIVTQYPSIPAIENYNQPLLHVIQASVPAFEGLAPSERVDSAAAMKYVTLHTCASCILKQTPRLMALYAS